MGSAPAQLTPATCCLIYADQVETVLVCLIQLHDVYYLMGLATIE